MSKVKINADLVMVSGRVSNMFPDPNDFYLASLNAFKRCLDRCEFKSAWWFTDICFAGEALPLPFVTAVPVRVESREDESEWLLHSLPLHRHRFASNHVLIIQADGFVVNPSAWFPELLTFDYIGAPWAPGVVGNGGFSLRSMRLLDCLHRLSYDIWKTPRTRFHEDWVICVEQRKRLEMMGCQFADIETAHRFSHHGPGYNQSFGIHGPEAMSELGL